MNEGVPRRKILKMLGLGLVAPKTVLKGITPKQETEKTPEETHTDFMEVVRVYEEQGVKHDDFLEEKASYVPYWIIEAYDNLNLNLNIDAIRAHVTSLRFSNQNDGLLKFSKLFLKSRLADADVLKVKELLISELKYVNDLKTIVKDKILQYGFYTDKNLEKFLDGIIDSETLHFITKMLEGSIDEKSLNLKVFFKNATSANVSKRDLLALGYDSKKNEKFLESLRKSNLDNVSLGFNEQEKAYCELLKQKLFPLLDVKKTNLAQFAKNAENIITSGVSILNDEKQNILSLSENKEGSLSQEQIAKGKILFYTFMTFLVKAWEGVHGEPAHGKILEYPKFDTRIFTDCSTYVYEIINSMFADQIPHENILHRGEGWPLDQIHGYEECLDINPIIKNNATIPSGGTGAYILAKKHHMILLYPNVERNYICATESSRKYKALYYGGDIYNIDNGVGYGYYDKAKPAELGYLCLTDPKTIEMWLKLPAP